VNESRNTTSRSFYVPASSLRCRFCKATVYTRDNIARLACCDFQALFIAKNLCNVGVTTYPCECDNLPLHGANCHLKSYRTIINISP